MMVNLIKKELIYLVIRLKNRDEIRGQVVTNKENDVIPGLVEHLMSDLSAKDRAKYSNDDDVVLVMTDEEGFPVDQEGELRILKVVMLLIMVFIKCFLQLKRKLLQHKQDKSLWFNV
jgi:hypothetical protein